MIRFAFDLTRFVVGILLFAALAVLFLGAALLMLIIWPVFLLALFV